MGANLTRRIAFAAVAIPALVMVLYVGTWALALVVAVAGVLGARELYDFAGRQGISAHRAWGFTAAVALPGWMTWLLEASARGPDAARPLLPVFWGALGAALWTMGLLTAAMRRGIERRPLAAVAVTLFAVLYASALPSFLLVLRQLGEWWPASRTGATALALMPLALTWLCDTAAMAAGHAWGTTRLAPVLSPNKTWAGAVGGGLAAVVAAPLYGRLALEPLGIALGLVPLLAIGAAVGVVAQVGDLAESLLKREVGLKDASALLPGHGGVIDRLDSLYFVVPVTTGILVAVWAV